MCIQNNWNSLDRMEWLIFTPSLLQRFVRDGKRKLLTASEAGVLVIITLKHAIFSLFFLSLVALDQAVFIVLEDIGSTGEIRSL